MVPAEFPDRTVCVIGLGYVGLTLAVAMAHAGFEVHGVEIRDDVLERLGRGRPHFHEPGLEEGLRRAVEGGLSFSKYIPPGGDARVYIITVGTPLDADGRTRLDMVENVSRELSGHLKDGDLVIIRSTVMLGTTRQVALPILRRAGVRFDIAFCPERTLEGKALEELHQLPQIIGGASIDAVVRASQIFGFLTPTIVRVSRLETAEMIKLIDNTSRDVHFAFANEVARLCDAAGISAAEVIRAGGLAYPRTNVSLPGPVGGPCLGKDPYILAEGLRALGVDPELSLAARRLNERQAEEVAAHLARVTAALPGFPARPVVTLMGLAFKGRPATDDLRGTTARPILEACRRHIPSARFRGYDAVVRESEIRDFGLEPCVSLEDAFAGSNLVLVLNNHPVFADMPVERLADRLARPGLIYDFWNNFDARELRLPEGTGYMALGAHGVARMPAAAAPADEAAS
ncbi:MAG: nucleotide sugar dehydrogenase [Kiloniellales bacterium]